MHETKSKALTENKNHPLVTALVMSTAVASALGFARFAYALVLPAMKTTLHWSYFDAGTLNIANAIGYMAGALFSAKAAMAIGTKRLYLISLVIIAATTLAPSLSPNIVLLLVERAISGIFGAVVMVTGGALIAHSNFRHPHRVSTTALGIYFGGAGLGIAISGGLLPALISHEGYSRWYLAWLVLGVLCVAALIANYFAVSELSNPTLPKTVYELVPLKHFRPTFYAYAIFGAGYISFMTFVVAYLKQQGTSQIFITAFYVILGVSAWISAFLWDRPLEALKKGYGLAATLASVAIGTLIPIYSQSRAFEILSAFFFGFALMAATTAVTRIAQRNAPPSNVTKLLGRATFFIGAGQSIGPFVTGILADSSQGLRLGMQGASILCLIAIVIALFQKDNSHSTMARPNANSIGSYR